MRKLIGVLYFTAEEVKCDTKLRLEGKTASSAGYKLTRELARLNGTVG